KPPPRGDQRKERDSDPNPGYQRKPRASSCNARAPPARLTLGLDCGGTRQPREPRHEIARDQRIGPRRHGHTQSAFEERDLVHLTLISAVPVHRVTPWRVISR